MTSDLSTTKNAQPPARQFRQMVVASANSLLEDWVGKDRAGEATGRIAVALSASAASAKNPQDFYDCTPQSVAKVIAISALTGIMVSTGQGALAYAIPRRPRKNDPPQLQYQLSHRGVAALALRAKQSLIAVPIGKNDVIKTDENGDAVVESVDFDNPPTTDDDLRGVLIVVKNVSTGMVICRRFVAKAIIHARRNQSDAYQYAVKNAWAKESDPWHKWPVEQCMKTAMHYAINRGWCVIDDTAASRALSADAEYDMPAARPEPKTITGIANQVQSAIATDETIDVETESADVLEPIGDEQPEPATTGSAETDGSLFDDHPRDNSTAGLLNPHMDRLDKCSTVSEIVAVKEKAQKDLPPPLFDTFATHVEAKKAMIKKK